jgi:hypothetical protein
VCLNELLASYRVRDRLAERRAAAARAELVRAARVANVRRGKRRLTRLFAIVARALVLRL